MTVKIGINGFGRIGRLAFRRIFELQARGGQAGDIEVAAINDLTTPSMLAYLLKYDSTHGTFRHDDGTPVEVTSTDDSIVVDGKEYKVYAEKDANNIPWVKNDGVEFVLECTGFYTSAEKSQAHINDFFAHTSIHTTARFPPYASFSAFQPYLETVAGSRHARRQVFLMNFRPF